MVVGALMEELMRQLDPHAGFVEFYKLMGAVLLANMLTVVFVWAAWNYRRLEREGREKQRGSGATLYLVCMAVVPLVVAGAVIAT